MNILQQAQDTIRFVRQRSDECLVFNSFGKDSLVTLDLVAPYFRRVVCVFMYFVPGLEHIERFMQASLCRYSNVEIMQIPHWNLTFIRRNGMYCMANPKQKLGDLVKSVESAMNATGIDSVFLGMKKADSMNRRLMLNTYEKDHYTATYKNNPKALWAYPVATWTHKEVLAYMNQKRLPSPIRYGGKNNNGVGFNEDCFLWMERNAPKDLERIYAEFPLSRRILFEYHYKHQEQ